MKFVLIIVKQVKRLVNMWYIVYRESREGYYVKYKDKIEDQYSPNWFEAGKYVSLGAALTRLGIQSVDRITTLDKFLEYNTTKNLKSKRNKKLNDILGEPVNPIDIIFSNGHIDKINEKGEFLGRADDEVMEFVLNKISKNKTKMDNLCSKIDPEVKGKGTYIIEPKEGEDFWEGF